MDFKSDVRLLDLNHGRWYSSLAYMYWTWLFILGLWLKLYISKNSLFSLYDPLFVLVSVCVEL